MPTPNVSIIIPAYDEAQSIAAVVRKIVATYPEFEIIVVNDGSNDDTAAIAAECGAIVHNHPYNMGNGAAIKSGIRIATGDILVFMDGDGQHDSDNIGKLIEHMPLIDMVVGARAGKQHASWARAMGNRALNRLATFVAKFPVQDLTSGFRAIKSDLARQLLYLLPNTYSYPTTLTLGVLRSGRSVKYIPVSVHQREQGKSKIKLFKDGLKFFMIITKICALYSPLRIFLPISLVMFLLGSGYYLYTFWRWSRFTNMSALLFTTSVLIFLLGLISEQICQMRFERSEGEH